MPISAVAYEFTKQQGQNMVGPSNAGDDSLPARIMPKGDKAPAGDKANASKKDVGKAPLYQGCLRYFPRALMAVAFVSEYGDRKYTPPGGEHYTDGWAAVPNGRPRYLDAESRHLLGVDIEGLYDEKDSGLAHAAQKAWNALADLERALREGSVEIRRGNDIVDGKPVLGTRTAVDLNDKLRQQ